jgi:signal transduction histidine kinase
MSAVDAHRHSTRPLAASFILLAAMIALMGYWAWRQQAQSIQQQADRSLAAVGALKANQISSWLAERRGDAESISGNPLISAAVADVLAQRRAASARADLSAVLMSYRRAYGYLQLELSSPRGGVLLSSPAAARPPDAMTETLVQKAVATGEVQFSDLYLDAAGHARLDFAAPVPSPRADAKSIAAVVLSVDPYRYLYPLIRSWPLPSATGETLLVERRGDRVLFLNDLRFRKNAALKLYAPVSDAALPAAVAVRGRRGIVQGIDYRGVSVLAAVQPVPATSWFIVSKEDTSAVLGPVRTRGWLTAGFALILVALAGVGALYLWHAREAQAADEVRALNAELEQRVRDRTAQLEGANTELEAFAYSVSHDLRAPLRHIGGFTELLAAREADRLDQKGKHYLDVITNSVGQMGSLIDDLLQFSRTGRAELKIGKVDMGDLVRDVLEPLKRQADDRDIVWSIKPLPGVSGDPALLRQVWVNLLDNAVKYTRGREPTRIEVSARDGDGANEDVFCVRDNGVGFDMQYGHKLFGVFQRLHSSAEFEGTGIGLANVQRIVCRHGGRVWAEGEPGKGATFFFALPRRKEAPS